MVSGMARDKVTITLDRAKAAAVQAATGAPSVSEAIDIALSTLILHEQIRNDLAAYEAHPPTPQELATARRSRDWSHLADDTDWDALYPIEATTPPL